MKTCLYTMLGLLAIAGCQSEPTVETESKPSIPPVAASGNESSTPEQKVQPGMDMAAVKKLKGAPKDTKHEHGANDAEIDLWIYDDETVKFQDGKVIAE